MKQILWGMAAIVSVQPALADAYQYEINTHYQQQETADGYLFDETHYGLGVGYYFTPMIALKASYKTSDVNNQSAVSLKFRF